MKKEALRVSTTIPAAPTTVYLAWLSPEQHSAMTSAAAKIEGTVGAKFSAANGYVSGKLVTLDLGRRIVMSWRTTDFPRDGADSRVEIHFEALGGSTRLTVLHTEIPEGHVDRYRAHWNDAYFGPMRTFFSKYLPDPRKPPPPRRPIPPEDEDDETEEEAPTPRELRDARRGAGASAAVQARSRSAAAAPARPEKPAAKEPPPTPTKKGPPPSKTQQTGKAAPAAKPARLAKPTPAGKAPPTAKGKAAPKPGKAPAKKTPPAQPKSKSKSKAKKK